MLRYLWRKPAVKVYTVVAIFSALLLMAVSCVSETPLGPIPTAVPEQSVKMKYIGEKGLVEFWRITVGHNMVCVAAIRPDSVDLECR